MDSIFAAAVKSLKPSIDRLLQLQPIKNGNLPHVMPERGVYLLSEGSKHLYVGRSNDLRGRYGRHCKPNATHRMAAFAFRLAREATGKLKASYKKGPDSRDGLMMNANFRAAFDAAKARIRAMDYRFVAEDDQVRQALLEIYVAVVLKTPYNDFNNH
ncbi:MAG: hypothetical protein HUU35_14935 [Armatimonadetes bacterium]|nr:hypothetical protein [Armatimonadota bacterium]